METKQHYKHCSECGQKKTSRYDLPMCYGCYMKTKNKILDTKKKKKQNNKPKTYGHKEEEGFSYDFSNPYINSGLMICGIGWIGGIWLSWSWWLGLGVGLLYLAGKKETFIYNLLHNKVSKEQSVQNKKKKEDKKKDKEFNKNSGMETWE